MTLREVMREIGLLGWFETNNWPFQVDGKSFSLTAEAESDWGTSEDYRRSFHIDGRPGALRRLQRLILEEYPRVKRSNA